MEDLSASRLPSSILSLICPFQTPLREEASRLRRRRRRKERVRKMTEDLTDLLRPRLTQDRPASPQIGSLVFCTRKRTVSKVRISHDPTNCAIFPQKKSMDSLPETSPKIYLLPARNQRTEAKKTAHRGCPQVLWTGPPPSWMTKDPPPLTLDSTPSDRT